MWACKSCGHEYRIKPDFCGSCHETGYHSCRDFIEIDLSDFTSPIDRLAQALLDGRIYVDATNFSANGCYGIGILPKKEGEMK